MSSIDSLINGENSEVLDSGSDDLKPGNSDYAKQNGSSLKKYLKKALISAAALSIISLGTLGAACNTPETPEQKVEEVVEKPAYVQSVDALRIENRELSDFIKSHYYMVFS